MNKPNADASIIDLSLCDREPIRTPGSIQPQGFLLALAPHEATILQLSDNVGNFTGRDPGLLLKAPLGSAIGEQNATQVLHMVAEEDLGEKPSYLGAIQLEDGACFDVLGHQCNGLVVLEFEAVARNASADFRTLFPLIGTFLTGLSDADSIADMSSLAVQKIKAVTGFGRVLVYRFDDNDHGHVIAEALDPGYHAYLYQRFPASDIPKQARELYLANRIRLIADANYTPARLIPEEHPITGGATDLGFASLRSVSPVHLQYMRNMGTLASMSISLVIKGKLWGLISCHHAEPRSVPFEIRAACEQLAQILALRIQSREENEEYNYRLELRRILVSMLGGLTQGSNFVDNMAAMSHELLRFASASGAAIVLDERFARFGDTPSEEQIRHLVRWLSTKAHGELFHTDALARVYSDGEAIKRNASGILAMPLSQIHQHYLIWFRPEVIQTIEWAGNPHAKQGQPNDPARLSPRTSFETWCETVHGTSLPWRTSELETALEFRTALLGIVLERAEQMAELAEELGRANKELESFSYSVSHDLRAPLRHIVGFSDLLLELEEQHLSERGGRFLRNIKDSARFAGKLVDDLLSFSQMGRASLRPREMDMNELVSACTEKLSSDVCDRKIIWKIAKLPTIQGDPNFLHLALYNLLSNAVKYTRTRDEAVIAIDAETTDDSHVFHVRDNGVGFNMEYSHKLFGVFQRLHRMEEFEGTGIGLANVRRIVERHGGSVWADGSPDSGATFSFSLPKQIPLD